MKLRILVVENDRCARSTICRLINARTPHTIVGEAVDGETAIQLASEQKPDLILMDAAMPGIGGMKATRRILAMLPETKVLALSAFSGAGVVCGMAAAGASGFVSKDNVFKQLPDAIDTVASGKPYLSPELAKDVAGSVFTHAKDGAAASPLDCLTDRERQVAELVGEGYGANEIAERLKITLNTASTHIRRTMEKLDIHTLPALAIFMSRQGSGAA